MQEKKAYQQNIFKEQQVLGNKGTGYTIDYW